MGDPRPSRDNLAFDSWDRANRHEYYPGNHMIENMNGNIPKLKDLTSGMKVKIKAYETHSIGYEYLYTTKEGKYARLHNIKVMQ